MLRKYQQDALDKLLWSRTLPGKDLAVLPQAAGKSHLIAAYAKAVDKPILILQPTRELILQNKQKLEQIVDPSEIAVYSAGLNSKKISRFTFGTVQSVIKATALFKHIDTIIVDEADLVNTRDTDTQYRRVIADIAPNKVIGLTATPYRMATRYRRWGKLPWQLTSYTVTELINRVYPVFWDRIVYQISHQELVDQGYLVPLIYVDKTILDHDQIPTNKSKSDFDLVKWHEKVDKSRPWEEITVEIKELIEKYSSVLVFTATVAEATALQAVLPSSQVLTSLTPSKLRLGIIQAFRVGRIKILINVQILTVGFDHPPIDAIFLLRPTRSFRLYQQLLGRGSRIFPGKKTCTVYDYSGTVKALGPIESIRIEKDETGKWDLVSETGRWGNRELYSFRLTRSR